MEHFTISIDFMGEQYECFVQKLKGRAEVVYMISFFDNTLIRLYKGKRIVLCAPVDEYVPQEKPAQPLAGLPEQVLFEQTVRTAIHRMNSNRPS